MRQWLWNHGQNGRFRYKKARARIQPSAIFIENFKFKLIVSKEKNKGKEAGNGPINNILIYKCQIMFSLK